MRVDIERLAPDLGRSTPGFPPQQAKIALARGPRIPTPASEKRLPGAPDSRSHTTTSLSPAIIALRNKFRSGATEVPLHFVFFGVATLCRSSHHWVTLGDLGSNWVYIGGRGRGAPERTGRRPQEMPRSTSKSREIRM